ncbi:MAG: hypothetical protein ACT4NY_19290 [Pseudonocardiales bacterium]
MIGGKVLDASAFVRGRISAFAWFSTARRAGIVLYLPSLALAEVRAVRPDASEELAEALGHPTLVVGELDAASARQVDQLLIAADVFDAMAGHVVHVARRRGLASLERRPWAVASRRSRYRDRSTLTRTHTCAGAQTHTHTPATLQRAERQPPQ